MLQEKGIRCAHQQIVIELVKGTSNNLWLSRYIQPTNDVLNLLHDILEAEYEARETPNT